MKGVQMKQQVTIAQAIRNAQDRRAKNFPKEVAPGHFNLADVLAHLHGVDTGAEMMREFARDGGIVALVSPKSIQFMNNEADRLTKGTR